MSNENSISQTTVITESLEDGSASWFRLPNPNSEISGEVFATFESGQWRIYAHVDSDASDRLFGSDQACAIAAAMTAAGRQCDALNAEIAARKDGDRVIGRTLRELRIVFGYTVQQAADLVGFPVSMLADIEEGAVPIWDSLNAQITKAYAGGTK